MTLVEFLEARYGEEAALARSALGGPPRTEADQPIATFVHRERGDVLCVDPLRVLADLASKRRILDLLDSAERAAAPDHDWPVRQFFDGQRSIIETAVRLLAQPFAAHPDYRAEWSA